MTVTIRAETPGDYAAIAALTYEAFVQWQPAGFKAEPLLVDLLRHHPLYDPELSLVAEREGRLVGHVLLTPWPLMVLGTHQQGAILAPLCVAPEAQRQGIGGALVQRAHEVARQKGLALSLLCGHPDYYPRFGYRQRLFSLGGIRVKVTAGDSLDPYRDRPVLAADAPWLETLWQRQHADAALAIAPVEGVIAWCSHTPACDALLIVRDEQPVGYVRLGRSHPVAIQALLVADDLVGVLRHVLHCRQQRQEGEFVLPADSAPQLNDAPGLSVLASEVATADAFMICVLDEGNAVVQRYCQSVQAGELEPAAITLPPMFDIDV